MDVMDLIDSLVGFGAGAVVSAAAAWYIVKQKYDIQFEALQNEANIKLSSLQNQLDLIKDHYEDKIETLEETKEHLRGEFENISNKIFKSTQVQSNENINLLLKPFKEQLNYFGTRVNEIYSEETKQRTVLSNQIDSLKELNFKLSKDAHNLADALKGSNKIQGDWGEMILTSILEASGLREGKEYTVQGSYVSEEFKRLRPDVIVHLPQNKDIIIDSKVSLKSYLNYTSSSEEDQKDQHLKDLLSSIKTHIKQLSEKKYEDIEQLRSLDFVLMFIPIEGAYMLASSKSEEIFRYAFENNIVLVTSSTLFGTLKTIQNIWQYEYQNQNAMIISKKAADLYDKFEGFVSDMEEIGKNLQKTKTSYENSINKLALGRGNLIKKVEEFKTLGVNPKKSIDKKYLEE
ncbi:MAG: DNA recombination protein RmuC [Campylobacterota bacterium]|nr:DNA recombination protein RmuC [Campylobacterota bacterium]